MQDTIQPEGILRPRNGGLGVEPTYPKGEPPFTDDRAAALCELVAVGATWEEIGLVPGMPCMLHALKWRRSHKAFRAAFDQARADSVAALVEEMRQIRDDGGIDARDKAVRLNSLQWELSRRDRAQWGDKVDVSGDITVTHNLSDRLEQARRRAIGRTIDVTPSLAAIETGGRGK